MQLPETFISTIKNVYKRDGERFLAVLPVLIDEVSDRWGLTKVTPVPNLSFNFVAFANRGDDEVILKMGVPNPELTSEMTALKLFNGDGACQLLEHDEERGLLLLERLKPGKMLAKLEDDEERTIIAAEVMSKLWREVSSDNKFIKLSDWFAGLKKIRPHFDGGTGPFPKKLLERVESFLPELFADTDVKLMHGDFHHFNILSSERGWLVIDPKGVIGPVGYEVGPLMLNPWSSISDWSRFKVRAERRVSILAERLGWEREKIINWSTAHAILSAWWSIEDNMEDANTIQCAEIFSQLK
ncbi:MAG TPA: aminoglycoside phosphotransferase family protein [Anaerolineales bacterium]|nr:aminoglycoside phosphotransferase family protein [Anaerolineales bacterium]HNJ13006.1 aminoglycoside phosphotransferase family protein [Anaerolineales bacterium]HNO83387.1 aminoglycoside phosphotransferase family protein [Anaerolineales bacterium]